MYPLDEQTIDVQLTVAGVEVGHRFQRPTKAQLVERDSRVKNEEVTIDDNQFETIYDDDAANVALWNDCVREVRGYDLGDGNLEWRAVDEQVRSIMPSEHKLKAVAALYYCSAQISKAQTNGGGFKLLGATETKIDVLIGDASDPAYTITHVLRRPTEGEWTSYRRGASRVVQVRGAKKPRLIMHANLSAAVAFYDALLVRIEGASCDGQQFSADEREKFVSAVDAIHKRVVVRAFADHWGADLGD